ncbi:hypothetical protein PS042_14885 [Escherichia albertii]|uniref:Uncharacterized protein n=3 Tax=Escherichia TaxID=561 RepID=A0A0K4KUB9_ECOLX|nr:hypothetical protein [Escherichia albertii]EFZ2301420.1 hypothetical protein [Shigella boydii]CTV16073.1 Uncharacterised protein [Escherichia coli]EEW0761424.1 hypothetical protein [Escherichia albertii]EEW0789914.1 hypothetical protein [Escherichia albertii]EFB5190093.1 hypothetical protein [Escherichia albertii]
MLQLCATLLNVTCVASLKMNEMLIKEIDMTGNKKIMQTFSLRQLTFLKGATTKNVMECNLMKNSIAG